MPYPSYSPWPIGTVGKLSPADLTALMGRLKPWIGQRLPVGLLSDAVWAGPEEDVSRSVSPGTATADTGRIDDAVGGSDEPGARLLRVADLADEEGQTTPGIRGEGPSTSAADGLSPADAMRAETARKIHQKESRWPTLFHEADRRKSIIEDAPGIFDVAGNADADSSTPWYASHDNGYNGVARNSTIVEREAKRIGVDPDLMRAIMYVEYANGYTYGGPAQLAHIARSLYPMNIRPDPWRALVDDDADLNDSGTNVRAGALLLKRIGQRLSDPSIAKIATLYNSLAKDQVTDYGAQVARVYRERPWDRKPVHGPLGRGPYPVGQGR